MRYFSPLRILVQNMIPRDKSVKRVTNQFIELPQIHLVGENLLDVADTFLNSFNRLP